MIKSKSLINNFDIVTNKLIDLNTMTKGVRIGCFDLIDKNNKIINISPSYDGFNYYHFGLMQYFLNCFEVDLCIALTHELIVHMIKANIKNLHLTSFNIGLDFDFDPFNEKKEVSAVVMMTPDEIDSLTIDNLCIEVDDQIKEIEINDYLAHIKRVLSSNTIIENFVILYNENCDYRIGGKILGFFPDSLYIDFNLFDMDDSTIPSIITRSHEGNTVTYHGLIKSIIMDGLLYPEIFDVSIHYDENRITNIHENDDLMIALSMLSLFYKHPGFWGDEYIDIHNWNNISSNLDRSITILGDPMMIKMYSNIILEYTDLQFTHLLCIIINTLNPNIICSFMDFALESKSIISNFVQYGIDDANLRVKMLIYIIMTLLTRVNTFDTNGNMGCGCDIFGRCANYIQIMFLSDVHANKCMQKNIINHEIVCQILQIILNHPSNRSEKEIIIETIMRALQTMMERYLFTIDFDNSIPSYIYLNKEIAIETDPNNPIIYKVFSLLYYGKHPDKILFFAKTICFLKKMLNNCNCYCTNIYNDIIQRINKKYTDIQINIYIDRCDIFLANRIGKIMPSFVFANDFKILKNAYRCCFDASDTCNDLSYVDEFLIRKKNWDYVNINSKFYSKMKVITKNLVNITTSYYDLLYHTDINGDIWNYYLFNTFSEDVYTSFINRYQSKPYKIRDILKSNNIIIDNHVDLIIHILCRLNGFITKESKVFVGINIEIEDKIIKKIMSHLMSLYNHILKNVLKNIYNDLNLQSEKHDNRIIVEMNRFKK